MGFELKREIGLFSATLYGVGVILGAGVYSLIGEAAGQAGNSVLLSFFFSSYSQHFYRFKLHGTHIYVSPICS